MSGFLDRRWVPKQGPHWFHIGRQICLGGFEHQEMGNYICCLLLQKAPRLAKPQASQNYRAEIRVRGVAVQKKQVPQKGLAEFRAEWRHIRVVTAQPRYGHVTVST